MDLKQIQETESPLLKRKEMEFEVSYDKVTPKAGDIKKAVAEKLKKNEDVIVVKKIEQLYGISKAKIFVKVYDSPEELKLVEIINKKPKKEKGEEKK